MGALGVAEMDLAVEVAKQVPALAIVVLLVTWFFKHLKEVRDDSEARLVEQSIRFQEKIREVVETYEKLADNCARALMTNTEMIGSIRTLFALVEDDLKNNAKRPR